MHPCWWLGGDGVEMMRQRVGGCRGVVTKVVAARGGEWCGGSYRSEEGECFWFLPESSLEMFSGGGGVADGGNTTLLVSISNEVLVFKAIKELYVSDENFCNTWMELKTKQHWDEFLVLDGDFLKGPIIIKEDFFNDLDRQHSADENLPNTMSISTTFNVLDIYEFNSKDVDEDKHSRTSSSRERRNDEDMINKLAKEYMYHINHGKRNNEITSGRSNVTPNK
nr:transposon Ty3-I Gag-Pol polyprotein [Tanacetum cinerariifolium]